jgi:hypothetical protein
MPSWQASETSGAPDPLADYRHRPIISGGGGDLTYVGRVIVELWESSSGLDDSRTMAMSAEARDGDHAALARRVAAALPRAVQRNRLFRGH